MKKKNCIEVKSTRRRLDILTFKVLMVRQRLRILKYTIITLIYNSQPKKLRLYSCISGIIAFYLLYCHFEIRWIARVTQFVAILNGLQGYPY